MKNCPKVVWVCLPNALQPIYNCVRNVRIRDFFCSHFPAYGLNRERYLVSPSIQSNCGKLRTRKTPNTDTFHAVYNVLIK